MVNEALADTLERSEIHYMTDRMNAIGERTGNPEGIEIKRVADCVAFYSKTMPWGLFNNVKGLVQEADIPELLQFYRERERDFEFHIIPSKANRSVLQALHRAGFYQSAFHTSLYCESREVVLDDHEEISVRELSADELDTYAEIHCLGTGLSLNGKAAVAENNRVLFIRPNWRYYIGFYRNAPAAVAVMHMEEGVASLTFAATLPQYRQQGLQTRLLQRRINDAYLNGCKLVVGQCTYCSASHRNMERVGMRIGYTRATWSKA